MAKGFNWERTRHDGKEKVSISSESIGRMPITPDERAIAKAENLARHKASLEFKKHRRLERKKRFQQAHTKDVAQPPR